MQRGWRSAAVALVATMVLTSGALAQRGGGGGFGGRGGGINMLRMPEVQTELKLTADQKTKIQEIVQQANNERRSLFQDGGGGGDREAMRAKMEELQKATDTKLAAVLTDAQKTKWKELVGAPFTFPAPGNVRAVS